MTKPALQLVFKILSGFGLVVVMFVASAFALPKWGAYIHSKAVSLLTWHVATDPALAANRVRALNLSELMAHDRKAALYLAKKYSVAPELIAALMQEANALAKHTKLDAYLLIAVVAIESSFHPYAQSSQGAQGLMQVITKLHAKRFEAYGGELSTFDPLVNLRVGSLVLRDFVKLKDGDIEAGLRYYLGGDKIDAENNTYVDKVLSEQQNIQSAATTP